MVRVAGVLLAAGRGTRFGGDKLIATLVGSDRNDLPIGIAAYRALACVIPEALVVLRPHDHDLRALFEREGANVVIARDAERGMGTSLAAGVESVDASSGVVVALADMPWIKVETIRRVARAIAEGASIAAPVYRGERGHPVGFAPEHRSALRALEGDEGARALLIAHRSVVSLIEVDDPGILRDVDTRVQLG
jgi:molybdenum cofactor cytidylyltransferase